MQLKHIALATLMALSLAACGGGDDAPTTQPNNPPKDNNDKKPTDDGNTSGDKVVDPTEAEVVSMFSLDEKPSSGSTFYRREDKSSFDRHLNPDKKMSQPVILGVNLDDQNPDLTNFVVQQYDNVPGYEGRFMYQVVGAREHLPTLHQADDPGNNKESIPYNNAKNILVKTDFFTGSGDKYDLKADPTGTAYETLKVVYDDLETRVGPGGDIDQLKDAANLNGSDTQNEVYLKKVARYKEKLEAYFETIKTAQEMNEAYIGTVLPGIVIQGKNNADSIITGFTGFDDAPFKNLWGDGVTTTSSADAQETNAEDEAVPGLVGVNYSTDPAKRIQGADDATHQNTRIFGKSYRNLASENVAGKASSGNSWMEAIPVAFLGVGGDTNHAQPTAVIAKKADDSAGTVSVLDGWDGAKSFNTSKINPRFDMAAVPMELKDVQYGRISAKADPLTDSDIQDGVNAYYVRYADHNIGGKYEKGADNHYFARGTNATTLEQMAELPVDKKIAYKGHALMFGLDNTFHGGLKATPNAPAYTQGNALGNFVVAQLDMKEKTFNGGVYNSWVRQNAATGMPRVDQDFLVEFTSNVHGNTAVGSAWRTYIAGMGDKADPSKDPAAFRASFFGKHADEVGGTISSIKDTAFGDGNGTKQGLWGGSFGAKQVDSINFLPGKWLGDKKN